MLPYIHEAYKSKGERLLNFMRVSNKPRVKHVLSRITKAQDENGDNQGMFPGLVLLFAAYMNEATEAIFHNVNVSLIQ